MNKEQLEIRIREDIKVLRRFSVETDVLEAKDFMTGITGFYSQLIPNLRVSILGEYEYNMVVGPSGSRGRLRNDIDNIKHDMKVFPSLLEGFLYSEFKGMPSESSGITVKTENILTQTTMVEVKIDNVIEQIERNESLTGIQIAEITQILNEIKDIVESKEKKQSKWESIGNLTKRLLGFSLEVGKICLPYVLQQMENL